MKQVFAIGLALALAGCSGAKQAHKDAAKEAASATGSPTPAPATETAANAAPDAFSQCAICHKVGKDEGNLVGPNLHGVVGRKAGTAEGFAYSPAMKDWGQSWTEANLDKYLTNPMAMIPGTKMSFGGQADAAKRKEIIEYLKKNK